MVDLDALGGQVDARDLVFKLEACAPGKQRAIGLKPAKGGVAHGLDVVGLLGQGTTRPLLHRLQIRPVDALADPVGGHLTGVNLPVLARVGVGEGVGKCLAQGEFKPGAVIGDLGALWQRVLRQGELKGGDARAGKGGGELVQVALDGVMDPAAFKVACRVDGVVFKRPFNALLKECFDVLALGKRDVWSLIPGESIALGRRDVTKGMGLLLKQQAVLMADVVGRA